MPTRQLVADSVRAERYVYNLFPTRYPEDWAITNRNPKSIAIRWGWFNVWYRHRTIDVFPFGIMPTETLIVTAHTSLVAK